MVADCSFLKATAAAAAAECKRRAITWIQYWIKARDRALIDNIGDHKT